MGWIIISECGNLPLNDINPSCLFIFFITEWFSFSFIPWIYLNLLALRSTWVFFSQKAQFLVSPPEPNKSPRPSPLCVACSHFNFSPVRGRDRCCSRCSHWQLLQLFMFPQRFPRWCSVPTTCGWRGSMHKLGHRPEAQKKPWKPKHSSSLLGKSTNHIHVPISCSLCYNYNTTDVFMADKEFKYLNICATEKHLKMYIYLIFAF